MTAVAVLGASGAVGRAAVALLRSWDVGPLRVGARRPPQLDGVDRMVVDARDPADLARFCAGARVVLNCAGPAVELVDQVARAAVAAGADYVDAAGDDALHAAVTAVAGGSGRTGVVSAGMMPGLTGLLPRLLAAHLPDGDRLTGYVGGRDRFTLTAAVDYVAADESFGWPAAAWRDGRVARNALRPVPELTLPWFPEPVTAQPYLGTETARVAAVLGLRQVDWYSVFAGERVLAALRTGSGTAESGHREAGERLCRAAELDLFGHPAYQNLVVTLAGPSGERTAVVRSTGASELTGSMAALTARAVLAGAVPPGVWHTDEVLDPIATVTELAAVPAVPLAAVVADVSAVEQYEEDVI
ncbi:MULTISPECIES: saccharopine dehydrogenase NADP-binding domain-containing protein [unclassified Micromonospora]|uniref:saccharopine dehydrogenase NADP-binding domain-containing protein n=1 Tax=unclassified Micromonospora TaxID=2617518 RepID=UPI0015916D9E|nr:saccharopine dehydrogenase NADP-binding domain-containing protein [Verrucosispora sp. NA02020]QKW14690.1 saccharopine dehydrogenase NADP-binding domain-containing protein [Verrucosispora sp. NA02020]